MTPIILISIAAILVGIAWKFKRVASLLVTVAVLVVSLYFTASHHEEVLMAMRWIYQAASELVSKAAGKIDSLIANSQ